MLSQSVKIYFNSSFCFEGKEITIRKRKDLNDEILNRIAKKSPKSLTITQCHSKHITEQGIRSLFQSCGENLLVRMV